MDGWATGLFALGGAVLGSVIATVGTYILDRVRRQQELETARSVQEHDALLELQAAWGELLRLWAVHDRELRFGDGIGVDSGRDVLDAVIRIDVLAGRVRNAEVRRLVNEARPYVTHINSSATEDWLVERMIPPWAAANERIGEAIRDL